MTDTQSDVVREDPPGWHVSWGGVITAFVVAIVIVVSVGYIFSTSDSSQERGKFWCNGVTGVYESRDGKMIVPEPYDPACHKVDEP